MGGAERLLGRGDMLYLPADAGRPERIQGAFLSDEEANMLADYWRQQIIEHAVTIGEEPAQAEAQPVVEAGWELKHQTSPEFELDDDLLDKAEEIVREYGRASISLLQRRLRVGYSRAARLIDLLEQRGIIGQSESGGRGREVYDSDQGNGYTQEVVVMVIRWSTSLRILWRKNGLVTNFCVSRQSVSSNRQSRVPLANICGDSREEERQV